MPCILPKKLSNVPVLGYLVAPHCPCDDVLPWTEFTELLEGMAGEYSDDVLARYRSIRPRRPSDALLGACKLVARKEKERGASYMFRSERGHRRTMYLVREVFKGAGRKPHYTRLGEARVEGDTLITGVEPGLDEADRGIANTLLAELAEQYEFARRTFTSNALSAVFRNEIRTAVPLAYDPDHLWRFVLVAERERIAAMAAVTQWATEQTGREYCVSTLPLPALDDMRGALVEAYKEEMARISETLGTEVAGLTSKYADVNEAPPAELHTMRERVEEAMRTYTTYAQAFGTVVAETKGTLAEMHHHLSVLEGRVAELAERGRTPSILDWRRVGKILNKTQAALGSALPEGTAVYPHLRTGADVLSWCVGTGDKRRTLAVQTNLADSSDLHITLVVKSKEVPKKVKKLFRRSAVGLVYSGSPANVTPALVDWFKTVTE